MFSKAKIWKVALILTLTSIGFTTFVQSKSKTKEIKKEKIVEDSCEQCQFGMRDKKGCDLAVRFGGKSSWVYGTKIDSHGDAHAKEGFCNAVRKAKVTRKVVDGWFVANSFVLLPEAKK